MHHYAQLGHCSVFSVSEVPECFVGQITILKYFAHYMEENLMDVSVCFGSPHPHLARKSAFLMKECFSSSFLTLSPCFLFKGGDVTSATEDQMPKIYLLQWLKSDRALMMLFNNGTFQVNTLPTIIQRKHGLQSHTVDLYWLPSQAME